MLRPGRQNENGWDMRVRSARGAKSRVEVNCNIPEGILISYVNNGMGVCGVELVRFLGTFVEVPRCTRQQPHDAQGCEEGLA
jgi:hypothetical protein